MRMAWHAKRNRLSGGLTALIFMVIIITGFGLYYGSEDWRDMTKWTHVFVGLFCILLLPLHFWWGKRSLHPHQYHLPH